MGLIFQTYYLITGTERLRKLTTEWGDVGEFLSGRRLWRSSANSHDCTGFGIAKAKYIFVAWLKTCHFETEHVNVQEFVKRLMISPAGFDEYWLLEELDCDEIVDELEEKVLSTLGKNELQCASHPELDIWLKKRCERNCN